MKKIDYIKYAINVVWTIAATMLALLFLFNLLVIKSDYKGMVAYAARNFAEHDFNIEKYRFYVPIETNDIGIKDGPIGKIEIVNNKKIEFYSYYYCFNWLENFFVISSRELTIWHVDAYLMVGGIMLFVSDSD